MKIQTKKLDKLKRSIKVEVSGDEFLEEKNKIFKEVAKTLKVPGFRPGSVPLDVLEKHHGKVLKEELLNRSLPIFYRKAIEEEKITPASLPQVSDVDISGTQLVFSAEFEIKPEIEIKDNQYKGIKLKDKKIKVEEIEIEKILTNLKEGIKKTIDKDLEDDGLARWASYPDTAALRQAIKLQLSVEKLSQRRQDIDSQLRQHLLKTFKIDLPAAEVERHHKELINREVGNLKQRGVSGEHLEKYTKEVEEKLKPVASQEVKLFYILEAIAKKEGFKEGSNVIDVTLGFILSLAEYK